MLKEKHGDVKVFIKKHKYEIIFGKERHPNLVYTDLATGEQFY